MLASNQNVTVEENDNKMGDLNFDWARAKQE